MDSLLDAFQSQVLPLSETHIKGGGVDAPPKKLYTSNWLSSTGVFVECIYEDGSRKYFSSIATEVSTSYLIQNGDNDYVNYQ